MAEASQGTDLAGVFWATLSHARYTPALEHRVLGVVHMLQHQVGMAGRVDLQRVDSMLEQSGAHSSLRRWRGRERRQARSHLGGADLVICQTGCLSHNACWRVKDHCKRNAKRCVFVESLSSAGLKRALIDLQPI